MRLSIPLAWVCAWVCVCAAACGAPVPCDFDDVGVQISSASDGGGGGRRRVDVTTAGGLTIARIDAESEDNVITVEIPREDLDVLVSADDGLVDVAVGHTVIGEGSSVNFVRITDARGLWLEGGRAATFDDAREGGFQLDTALAVGGGSLGRCEGTDRSVEAREVEVAFDDGVVVADREGVDGVLRGVDVRAVGLSASRGDFFAWGEVTDGYGAGPHTTSHVHGLVFRR